MRRPAKKATSSTSVDDTASSSHRVPPIPPIMLLPEDILARILGSTERELPLKEWVDYALVNRSWYSTMKQLVAAEFWIHGRSNLQQLEKSKVRVGSIRVLPGTPQSLASALERVLSGKKVSTSSLTTLVIDSSCFTLRPKHFTAWLPRLSSLRVLNIPLNSCEAIENFVAFAPPSLRSLTVRLKIGERGVPHEPGLPRLQRFAQLTQLEALNITAHPGLKPSRETMIAHREKLFGLLSTVKAIQGSSMQAERPPRSSGSNAQTSGGRGHKTGGKTQITGGKAGRKRKVDERPCAKMTRASKKQAAQIESLAEQRAKVSREEADDAETQEEGASRKASDGPQECCIHMAASPRVAAVSALADVAARRAATMKVLSSSQNSSMTDCIHTLLQALQWQLGLAQVMDEEEPCRTQSNVAAVQGVWQKAELGSGWLDLRPLTHLTSLRVFGHPFVWLPAGLTSLDVDSWGYTGPLPPQMANYTAQLRASPSMTNWDLRPTGLLPLSRITLSVECSEERRNREFCFHVLQGSHSLQLYRQLQELSLSTDRSLHVDARISHSLLSLLAQRGQLRRLVIGSGSYRLQGSGDFLGGRGVAALNLLSDLQDHCGWHVEQQPRSEATFRICNFIQRTVCKPPEEWQFDLPNHPPDFISDFE